MVERGARLPAALEGAGVLGRREHGEQGEQGKAGRSHLVVGHAVVGLTCATAITTCAMGRGGGGREGAARAAQAAVSTAAHRRVCVIAGLRPRGSERRTARH